MTGGQAIMGYEKRVLAVLKDKNISGYFEHGFLIVEPRVEVVEKALRGNGFNLPAIISEEETKDLNILTVICKECGHNQKVRPAGVQICNLPDSPHTFFSQSYAIYGSSADFCDACVSMKVYSVKY